ncbi:TRAP transporter small permease subunit [Venatoribacter cucullus]|nr:TRAP transporter small permease subunit [Venatoribacter cucullus]
MNLLSLEQGINRISDGLGKFAAVLFLLMLLNVFYDVSARYLFNSVSIGMQELEWHLFAAMFMLGIPFALRAGSHVRVDIIYDRLSRNRRAWIDILCTLFLLFPFTLLVAWYGIGFAYEAYQIGEGSPDPGGLPQRWVIRSVITIAMVFNFISGIGLLLHSINILRGHHQDEVYVPPQH